MGTSSFVELFMNKKLLAEARLREEINKNESVSLDI